MSSGEGLLLQAGTIPYRRCDGRLEYCLITSASGRRWGFPKGIIDPGQSAEDTAHNESWEEAGIRGQLSEAPIGSYRYEKWDTTLEVSVYLLQVDHESDDWQENGMRTRRWLCFEDAVELIDREGLKHVFQQAHESLAG